MKRHIFLFSAALIFLLSPLTPLFAAPEEEALMAAMEWIVLVDEGNYSESWHQASSYFKKNITEDQWVTGIKGVRDPLGKVLTRKFSSSQFHTSLPGAPDGKYVVITLISSFENKKEGIETITPMLDQDGMWRVSGYYIK